MRLCATVHKSTTYKHLYVDCIRPISCTGRLVFLFIFILYNYTYSLCFYASFVFIVTDSLVLLLCYSYNINTDQFCIICSFYCSTFNPFKCKGNYSATSNNMKLVHWSLMNGLLHLVQPQLALAARRCTKRNMQPTHQRPVYQLPHCCMMIRCSAVLTHPFKG